jgi:hypothetical protein
VLDREFPERHAQDIPVDRGDLVKRPFRRVDGNDLVEIGPQGENTKDDLPRKIGKVIGKGTVLQA